MAFSNRDAKDYIKTEKEPDFNYCLRADCTSIDIILSTKLTSFEMPLLSPLYLCPLRLLPPPGILKTKVENLLIQTLSFKYVSNLSH